MYKSKHKMHSNKNANKNTNNNKNSIFTGVFSTIIATSISFSSWSLLAAGTGISKLPSDYDLKHPYYLKFCPTSQWTPKVGGAGVPTGHTVLYIKGACIDQNKDKLPTLRACKDDEVDLTNPESGVGISTDGSFKNTIFSTIPGLTPFISAGLSEEKGDVLNQDTLKKILDDYTDKGYFDGLELNHTWFDANTSIAYGNLEKAIDNAIIKEKNATTEEERALAQAEKAKAIKERARYIGDWMLGTEFGLQLSRYLFCINIPVSKNTLQKVINHLNKENDALATSKGTAWRGDVKPASEYIWDPMRNNCDHTGHNAIAATGAVSERLVDHSFTELSLDNQIFNLAVPGKSLLEIHNATMIEELEPMAIYKNKDLRESLLNDGWLPIRHDILVENIPFYKNNEIYADTAVESSDGNPYMIADWSATLIAKYLPYFKNFAHKFARLIDKDGNSAMNLGKNALYSYQPENGGLKEHYKFFKNKYETALKKLSEFKDSKEYRQMRKDASDAGIEKLLALKENLATLTNDLNDEIRASFSVDESSSEIPLLSVSSSNDSEQIKIIKEKIASVEKEIELLKESRNYFQFLVKYEQSLKELYLDLIQRN